jgi:hypothetical protein
VIFVAGTPLAVQWLATGSTKVNSDFGSCLTRSFFSPLSSVSKKNNSAMWISPLISTYRHHQECVELHLHLSTRIYNQGFPKSRFSKAANLSWLIGLSVS